MEDVFQLKSRPWGNNDVNMIGHNNPLPEVVPYCFKVAHTIGYYFGNFIVRQNTGTHSGIQPLLDFIRELLMEFMSITIVPGFWMIIYEIVSLNFSGLKLFLGN